MNALTQILQPQKNHLLKQGHYANFHWSWWDEGVVCLTPNTPYDYSIVISAGIHGNETAPIELLFKIYDDLFTGHLPLNVGLLLILGNPESIRQNVRYIDYDMNRMFCGAHQHIAECKETVRTKVLEEYCIKFYQISPQTQRYHYDLHTAIREAVFPTFAMLPYQEAYDLLLLQQLNNAELDALVYHQSAGQTFSHFTMQFCHAHSATLELGKARAFGENNLASFESINCVLRSVLAQTVQPIRCKDRMKQFSVQHSIIKKSDQFELNLSLDAANFLCFKQGEWVAKLNEHEMLYASEDSYILFPNPHVAIGLRAGLLLRLIE